MDPATLGGVVLAFGALLTMMVVEGANPAAILLPGPMVLVFGASFGVAIASSTLPGVVHAVRSLPRAFLYKRVAPRATVDTIVALANIARKQGLLALEDEAGTLTDPFLVKAIRNIADGVDADELRTMLEDEAATIERSARAAAKFFNSLGGFAPTIGIIGTVVSLTHVLENLADPAALGHSIAGAFVATLWGVMSANLIWLPIGGRLATIAALESERLGLVIEGVVALQAGAQPRVLGEKLLAMVPAHEQAAPKAKGADEPAGAAAPQGAEAVVA